ncbi:MAG TPA: PfkB family carbohydrate kinase [Solirubrobacterales bacterium]|jgi:1-phosphofructokinase|nr:PfkB family carbohydrate kinase [Solirubrobacterales bacterium]
MAPEGKVAVFAPNPLLGVTIEARGPEGEDDIHVHPAGQGVWLTRMCGELGASPTLCGLIGGETGSVLQPLLDDLPGETRLVRTDGSSGCYVIDRRSGERRLVAESIAPAPTRHELDDLFAATCTAALHSRVLAVCNPYPGEALPLDVYGNLVTDARANGVPVVVDLSSPRLEAALEGGPDLVKLNEWELAEFVFGPVSEPDELRAAAQRILDRGADTVVVTRAGDPALVLRGDAAWWLVPPRFERGSREGCGDSMMGGIASAYARGLDLKQTLVIGAAAGAVNFLRHGLGTGSKPTVEEMIDRVRLDPA